MRGTYGSAIHGIVNDVVQFSSMCSHWKKLPKVVVAIVLLFVQHFEVVYLQPHSFDQDHGVSKFMETALEVWR